MLDFHDYVCLGASGGKECMVNMKKIKNIQIDDETYEICGGGTSEKEWTVIMDELLTEDTQAIVKSNINFREIQVFVELQPSDAQKTIYLTSSSGGNIYGDPRVSINIANTYAGGICFLGIRVISPHMWELTRYLQPYKSGANLQNKKPTIVLQNIQL